jgi:hypothetical protein
MMAAAYYTLEKLIGEEPCDWSDSLLAKNIKRKSKDTRIADIKDKRVTGTEPVSGIDKCTGVYTSDIYGNITVADEQGTLRLYFQHSPGLSATLSHWHYDVWEIKWDEIHAWFGFGTVKFVTDNNMEITGLEFDVPNNDIFFEELKPYRIQKEEE